jgi:hypothetical protein
LPASAGSGESRADTDLCNSRAYFELLQGVAGAQSWVRYSALVGGGLLLVVLVRSLMVGHWVGIAGYVVLALLAGLSFAALRFYWVLETDIRPYGLTPTQLCHLRVREVEVVKFGNWLSAGSSWNRFERIYWQDRNDPGFKGRSPYVRAIYSAFVDLGDTVLVGEQVDGDRRPIFLGVKRAPPPVLVQQPPASLRELYAALDQWMKVSRRWSGNRLSPSAN